jgi:hypothetical protein
MSAGVALVFGLAWTINGLGQGSRGFATIAWQAVGRRARDGLAAEGMTREAIAAQLEVGVASICRVLSAARA